MVTGQDFSVSMRKKEPRGIQLEEVEMRSEEGE